MTNSNSRVIIVTIFCCCVLLIACGSDNDVTTPSSTKIAPEVAEEISKVEIDFDAEEEKIGQMLSEYATAHAEDDIDKAMKYWLKLEKSEVFMGKHGWGAFMLTEKWSGIKEDFELTKKKIGHNPVPSVPEKIGIDSRAKNATVRGKTVRSWGGSALYLASLRKDKNGEWRIRGIDFYSGEDHKLIKEIKTRR